MIRRGFWLTAGAALGIAGYRRLSRAARSLLPHADLLTPSSRLGGGPGQARRAAGGPQATGGTGAGTAAFMRDVRIGMADYLDRRRDI